MGRVDGNELGADEIDGAPLGCLDGSVDAEGESLACSVGCVLVEGTADGRDEGSALKDG